MMTPNPAQGKPQGLVLKEEREKRNISLLTVHESTKIPLDVLKAIEEGYTVRTLSPFYLRGFIKMYALYLGLDLKEILEDYHEEKLPSHVSGYVETVPEPAPPEKVELLVPRHQQIMMLKIIGIIIALFLVTRIFACAHKSWSQRPKRQRRPTVSRPLPKLKVETKESVQAKPLTPTVQAEKKTTVPKIEKKGEPPKTEKKTGVSKVVPAAKPEVTPAAQVQVTKPEQKLDGKVTLKIKVLKNGWLQVKADGNIVFQSTIQEGVVESWQAKKSIELSGKVIQNLEYEVNGSKLGPLSRDDRTARRVLITQDGLSVKK
jgi:cytoskeleton protein RodZ